MEKDRGRNSRILKGFGSVGVSFMLAACGAGANVTPPRETPAFLPTPTEAATPEPRTTQELLDHYLNPEAQSDIDKQFIARAMRFWLETYTTKAEPFEIYEGASIQVETNIDEWIQNVPDMLSQNLNNDGWALWAGTTEAIFEAKCKYRGLQGVANKNPDKDVLFQAKNIKFGALPIESFSEAQRENGWQRIEDVFFKYIWRTKEGNEDWSEWHDFSGSPYFQFQLKNNEITMSTNNNFMTGVIGLIPNETDNPREEMPHCER